MKKSILPLVLSLIMVFSITTPALAATKETTQTSTKTITTFNNTVTISNVTRTGDPYTDDSFDRHKTDKMLEVSDRHRSGNDNNELYFTDVAPVTITFKETGNGDYGINGYQVYCIDAESVPTFDITKYDVSVYDYNSYTEEKITAQAFTGTITLNKPGSYYLFLTNYSASGKDCDAGIYIVVGDTSSNANETAKATGITLNKSKLSLVAGKTTTLKATVAPSDTTDKSVTWDSSNTKVATVSKNGKVSAKAAGTATITATTADGSKKVTCKVTVTKEVKTTGVTLNKEKLSLTVGKSSTLKATITPAKTTDATLTWTSSDAKVATVNKNGKVTSKAKGTATITVKTINGKTATCKVTVK